MALLMIMLVLLHFKDKFDEGLLKILFYSHRIKKITKNNLSLYQRQLFKSHLT